MRLIKLLFAIAFMTVASSFFYSCKKESPCEGCRDRNKPPVANAGPNHVITSPTDSISLDGSASNDPDGMISEWLWTKISGPASFNIVHAHDSVTKVKNLVAGVYRFELKVTDDGGLIAKDTVQVTANNLANRPPVANAGADTSIALPANSVTLDGSGSTDPDNNITTYTWTKISGPSSFNISNSNAIQTQVINLIEGIYRFELKVIDAGGLFSKDTVQVTVTAASDCNDSNRPEITVRLTPIGILSKSRHGMAIAAAGNKIVFAGGDGSLDCPECWGSPRVDIYDLTNNTWSTAELSEGRWSIGAVAADNKIFFAGGQWGDGAFDSYYTNVDIFDASSNTWKVVHLSEPRAYISAGAVGDQVFFAGGEKNMNYETSPNVDIYDIATGSFSYGYLSEPRAHVSAVTVNNKIYFAGGEGNNRWYNNPSNKIDIFDNTTRVWSTSSLSEPMNLLTGITMADKIYWASGCTIEIKDIDTWSSSIAHPYKRASWFIQSVSKDNFILFLGGYRGSINFPTRENKIDIYNTATNTWSIGVLPVSIESAISYNNEVYVTDGVKVYKLEF